MNETFYGTEQTYPITITADGFNMANGSWSVTCWVGLKSVECPKKQDINGDWYFTLDTSALQVGICRCVVEYDVNDEMYDDNLRHVVYKENLVNIKSYERL